MLLSTKHYLYGYLYSLKSALIFAHIGSSSPGFGWFKESLGIKQMPSSSTLRLRFNEDAKKLIPAIEAALPEVLINRNAPLTPLAEFLDPSQHTPLDIDVSPQDKCNTKKEGVSCTYKHFDGYAPNYCLYRSGRLVYGFGASSGITHSQNDFIPYLNTVIRRARRFTQNCLLLRLDSAHDAEDTRKEVARHKNIDHIIKLNPRTEHTITKWLPKFEAEGVEWQELRPGKKYTTHSVINETEYGKQRLIIRIIKRTTDSVGQMFLTPDYELDGWWTTLSEDNYNDDHIILLYEDHATSEQFHSEFKTDMDLERPPSGKFDTNDLVMCLGALAYNILRNMGQASLLGPESPIRHSAARRRIKTVIQNLGSGANLIFLSSLLKYVIRRINNSVICKMCSTQVLCPKCGSDDIKNFGYSKHNEPRYFCCNDECKAKSFMLKYRYKAYEPGVKEQVVDMAINGSGIRDTSRVLGINKKTVINTLKRKEDGLVQVNPNIQKMELGTGTIIHVGLVCQEAEIDEQWSYVFKKSNQRWLWYAIDHSTNTVLAYVFGKRKDEVFKKLKKLLEPFGIKKFYTDDWGAYDRHLEENTHIVGKKNTQKIERKNLNFRTWIKRLARKTICFSKLEKMHDIVIGLLINKIEFGIDIHAI